MRDRVKPRGFGKDTKESGSKDQISRALPICWSVHDRPRVKRYLVSRNDSVTAKVTLVQTADGSRPPLVFVWHGDHSGSWNGTRLGRSLVDPLAWGATRFRIDIRAGEDDL